LTDCANALALHVLEKGSLLRAVDFSEAEVVLVTGGHMNSPSAGAEVVGVA
jgi:hypothetical protein